MKIRVESFLTINSNTVEGEEVLYDMMDEVDVFHDNWNNIATDEFNKDILDIIQYK